MSENLIFFSYLCIWVIALYLLLLLLRFSPNNVF